MYCNLWEYWIVQPAALPYLFGYVTLYNAYQKTYLSAPASTTTRVTGTASNQTSNNAYFRVIANADGTYSFKSVSGNYLMGGVNYLDPIM
jgi:hypothetical protein